MEYRKTKLVEEDNTIYEIDLDCMRRKQDFSLKYRKSCAMIKNNDDTAGGKNRAEIRSKRT